LYHIEPGDSWLSNAVPRIFERRFNKSIHRFGVHVNVDMNNEHASMFDADLSSCKGGGTNVSVRSRNDHELGNIAGDNPASEITGGNQRRQRLNAKRQTPNAKRPYR